MEANTSVRLIKPEAPDDAESIARMRSAIEQDAARKGSLIGDCLAAARARGLDPEETYVFLAFHALLQLEETHQRHVYLSDIAPYLDSLPRDFGIGEPGVGERAADYLRELGRRVLDVASRARISRAVHRLRWQ